VITQKLFLLLFGYFIYATVSIAFATTLAVFTSFTWGISFAFVRARLPLAKNILFWVGVTGALSLLVFFKYFNFFSGQVATLTELLGLEWAVPVIDILMPLGISFYVFQSISYLHAVRYESNAVSNPLDFGLYLCFLPTLIAGPICRPSELLTQISSPDPRCCNDITSVFLLILSFVVKKVWLASWLAQSTVDPVFADPSSYNSIELILSAIAYALQIFFDFSGYTDLATAAAILIGYRLPKNFRTPYLAKSLSDFWARWHISLSRWIRDYIYIPLGGSRGGMLRTLTNLMIAMTLSGLWHGASLKYGIWGFFHGTCLCSEKLLQRCGIKNIGMIPTFMLVCIGWVFFRSPTLTSSLDYFIACMNWKYPMANEFPHLAVILLIFISFTVWSFSSQLCLAARSFLDRIHPLLRPIPIALICTLVLSLAPEGMPKFIYAQY
jgi:D-alanyl-lipoteichoic acid acyltransferase DltB (MBOAT superfamily)